MSLVDEVRFGEDGLVPVAITDAEDVPSSFVVGGIISGGLIGGAIAGAVSLFIGIPPLSDNEVSLLLDPLPDISTAED